MQVHGTSTLIDFLNTSTRFPLGRKKTSSMKEFCLLVLNVFKALRIRQSARLRSLTQEGSKMRSDGGFCRSLSLTVGPLVLTSVDVAVSVLGGAVKIRGSRCVPKSQ